MNKVWLGFIGLISLVAVMVPGVALADDGQTWMPEFWPKEVSGRQGGITTTTLPPMLEPYQLYRWAVASPSGKARLAKLWGIEPEIAVLYGARFTPVYGRCSCFQ